MYLKTWWSSTLCVQPVPKGLVHFVICSKLYENHILLIRNTTEKEYGLQLLAVRVH